jgi:hypothetical protein
MIVGAKGLADQVPFCSEELKELFGGLDQMLKSGPPAEVPAAIPIGQLGRIVGTLKQYRELCQTAVSEDTEDVQAVLDEMKELLDVSPPVAKPSNRLLGV